MAYFPHPDKFFAGTGLNPADLERGRPVTVDGGVLRKLLSLALASADVDAQAYMTRYPDLRSAHDGGQITDLNRHYREAGFVERRYAVPANFDAAWYAQAYPDVRLALETGSLEAAADHFVEVGVKEWRLPCAAAREDVLEWRRLLQG